jgi:hypothetical protein
MIERYLLILLAVVLLGSIGAFFLFVAILPVIAIAAVLTGLAVMFGLGFYAGQIRGGLRDLIAHLGSGQG